MNAELNTLIVLAGTVLGSLGFSAWKVLRVLKGIHAALISAQLAAERAEQAVSEQAPQLAKAIDNLPKRRTKKVAE